MNAINRLSLPVTILIGCIILGFFYYFGQLNKQKSIERQQMAKIINEKESLFYAECKKEIADDFKSYDAMSPILAKMSLMSKGYVDDGGNFVDDDVWVKNCVRKKLDVWN